MGIYKNMGKISSSIVGLLFLFLKCCSHFAQNCSIFEEKTINKKQLHRNSDFGKKVHKCDSKTSVVIFLKPLLLHSSQKLYQNPHSAEDVYFF